MNEPRSRTVSSARLHTIRRVVTANVVQGDFQNPKWRLLVRDDWQATGYGGTVKRVKSVEEKIAESSTLDDAAKATVQEREVRD
jgi:glycerol-3-phosphate dehydrogenase